MVPIHSAQRLVALCTSLAVLATAVAGCAWFDEGQSVMSGFGARLAPRPANADSNNTLLKPIPVPPDAIQLEAICIEAPIGDPLLGPQLWKEVATIGSLDPKLRDSLRRHGFRIGHVSVTPPRALQDLLTQSADTEPTAVDQIHKSTRHRFTLLAGTRGEVSASDLYPECTLAVPGPAGEKTESFQQSRFVLSVTAQRLQDGWARLEFLPEIHHGAMTLRPTAVAGSLQARTSQSILPLYSERFSVELAEGEMVVLAADDPQSDTLASWFFRSSSQDRPVQRLLIVRLMEMEKMQFLYSEPSRR